MSRSIKHAERSFNSALKRWGQYAGVRWGHGYAGVRSCIHTSPDPVTRRYDALQRLTTATRILGGAVNYSYSPSGNILSKSDYGSSYGYQANGCGPHAASSISVVAALGAGTPPQGWSMD